MTKKVKDGDVIAIGGVKYRIGKTSAEAINVWLELSEKNRGYYDPRIHLYRVDGGGDLILASQVKKALEK